MEWPDRARAAKLPQRLIAELIGYTDDGVSRGLRADPPSQPALAIIAAWEIMTPEQRAAWLAALGVPAERPRRGRPRKSGA